MTEEINKTNTTVNEVTENNDVLKNSVGTDGNEAEEMMTGIETEGTDLSDSVIKDVVQIGETNLVERKPGTVIVVPEGANADEILAALEDSPESLDKKGEVLCRWAAGRAGVIVLAPVLGTVALMANEFYLVNRLAKVYNKDVSDGAIIGFLGAFGGTLAGNLLATLLPFGAVQVPIAVGITYSVGKVAQAWIRDGMPKNMEPYMELYKEWSEKAKVEVKILAEDPLKNVPLGDETKDYLLDSGSRLKVAIGEMKEKVADTLLASRDKVQARQAELADKAMSGSEEFRQKATEKIQKAKVIATEGSQIIREKAVIGADIFREKAGAGAELLKEKATASAEIIREKAAIGAEVITEKANTGAEVIKEKAAVGAETIKEKADAGADLIKEKSKLVAEGATEVINTAADKAGTLAEMAKEKFQNKATEDATPDDKHSEEQK